MEEKIKRWIEREYADVKDRGYDVHTAVTRSYGIMMFAVNELFEEYNEDLVAWWDNEMLPKFRKEM